MKECPNCKKSVDDSVIFCPACGTNLNQGEQNSVNEQFANQNNYQMPPQYQSSPMQGIPYQQPIKRDIPKCTCCGYIGQWKLGPILRPMDIIIGIILLVFGIVPGIVYVGVVAAIRSNKDRREKICPQCKAKNLWTFLY